MSVALTRARVFGVPWWRRAIAWFRGRGIKALALPLPSWPRPAHPTFSVMLPPRDMLSVDISSAMHRVRSDVMHRTILEFGEGNVKTRTVIERSFSTTVERSQRPPPTSMPGPLDSRKG